MVLGLITANIVVFCLWKIADFTFMYRNFTISVFQFKLGQVHTLITYAFSHSQIGHIVSNMLGLYLFGTNIGRVFGPEFLLKLYIAGAIGGSVFHLVHHAFLYQTTPVQGASGAVNAIMLLDIFIHPAVPAVLLGIFLIGKDIPRIMEGNAHVKGSTHLGGAVVAAVTWARLRRRLRVF
ncbi:PREDICTED: rhomboid protein 1, mitochondrial-like [Fragaria vesca subsp. vesca]